MLSELYSSLESAGEGHCWGSYSDGKREQQYCKRNEVECWVEQGVHVQGRRKEEVRKGWIMMGIGEAGIRGFVPYAGYKGHEKGVHCRLNQDKIMSALLSFAFRLKKFSCCITKTTVE